MDEPRTAPAPPPIPPLPLLSSAVRQRLKERAEAELVVFDEEEDNDVDLFKDEPCRCVPPLVVGIAGASRSGKTTLSLGLLGALGGSRETAPATPLFESYDPRTIVHLDRYFKDPREMEKIRVGRRMVANWEVESSLRWDEFIEALRRQIERKTLMCPRCAAEQARLNASSSSTATTTTTTSSASAPTTPRRPSTGSPASPRRARSPPPSAPSSPMRRRQHSLRSISAGMLSRDPSLRAKRKMILVEGFLLFSNKEVLSLIDRHIFITVDRSVSRQRRIDTMGTPGWYFDRVVWPHYLKANRGVLELPQRVLVVDGHTERQAILRQVADFIEDRDPVVDDSPARVLLQHVLQEAQPPSLLAWF